MECQHCFYEMLFARLAFVCSLARFFLPTTGSDTFVVDTGYAKYLGNHTLPNTVAYLGIPYAEPPLAERRFRAPLPLNTTRVTVESGNQPIDARSYPDFCIQGTVSGIQLRPVPRMSADFHCRYSWWCWIRGLPQGQHLRACLG